MRHSVILILWLVALDAMSQDSKKINLNVSLGTSYSIPYSRPIGYEYTTNYKSSFGYYMDLMVNYKINNHFILSSGANVYQNRFKIHRFIFDMEGGSYENGFINTYCLSVPILIKYKFSDKIPLSIGVGPYCDLIIRVKDKGKDTTYYGGLTHNPQVIVSNYNNDITDTYNLFDLGAAFLLEYELIKTKSYSISLFSKFNFGVTNVLKRDPNSWNSYFWRNYTLFFGLGINF